MAIAAAPMHAEAIAAADMRGIGAAGAVLSARGQATTIATMAQVKSTVTSGYDAGVPRYATDRSGQANIRTARAKIASVPGVQVRDMCGRPSIIERRVRFGSPTLTAMFAAIAGARGRTTIARPPDRSRESRASRPGCRAGRWRSADNS